MSICPYLGNTTRFSCPNCSNALGNDAATSPNPPAFAKGATSADIVRIFILCLKKGFEKMRIVQSNNMSCVLLDKRRFFCRIGIVKDAEHR